MSYYHYCSTEAFFHIVKNKSIWLSSLTSSNDSLEGKWVANVLSVMCDENGVPPSDRDALLGMVSLAEGLIDCLGFCMSEVDDALSQWRGYADDGAGVSIKLSPEFIERFKGEISKLEVSLQRVVYSPREQRERIRPSFDKITHLISQGALRPPLRGTILSQKPDEQFDQGEGRLWGKERGTLRRVNGLALFCPEEPGVQ